MVSVVQLPYGLTVKSTAYCVDSHMIFNVTGGLAGGGVPVAEGVTAKANKSCSFAGLNSDFCKSTLATSAVVSTGMPHLPTFLLNKDQLRRAGLHRHHVQRVAARRDRHAAESKIDWRQQQRGLIRAQTPSSTPRHQRPPNLSDRARHRIFRVGTTVRDRDDAIVDICADRFVRADPACGGRLNARPASAAATSRARPWHRAGWIAARLDLWIGAWRRCRASRSWLGRSCQGGHRGQQKEKIERFQIQLLVHLDWWLRSGSPGIDGATLRKVSVD